MSSLPRSHCALMAPPSTDMACVLTPILQMKKWMTHPLSPGPRPSSALAPSPDPHCHAAPPTPPSLQQAAWLFSPALLERGTSGALQPKRSRSPGNLLRTPQPGTLLGTVAPGPTQPALVAAPCSAHAGGLRARPGEKPRIWNSTTWSTFSPSLRPSAIRCKSTHRMVVEMNGWLYLKALSDSSYLGPPQCVLTV